MNSLECHDLRAAYCAHHRIPAERFESSVFWRCLRRHAILPLLVTGGPRGNFLLPRRIFRRDFEHIAALGECRSERELTRTIEGIVWEYHVERDLIRTWLWLRLSLSRLDDLFRPLIRLVPAPEEAEVPAATGVLGATSLRPARAPVAEAFSSDTKTIPFSRAGSAGRSDLTRRLERLHEQVVSGRAWSTALMEAGLNEVELDAQLERLQTEDPRFGWLRTQLHQEAEMIRLRSENARLARMVASLSLHVAGEDGVDEFPMKLSGGSRSRQRA